jgi:diadenosine tetraphosphate (Ap4A) HIT family hydrolase
MAEGARCERCGFSLWVPIVALDVSTLGLYDDRRYPGRCLLVLNEHFEDLGAMPGDLACALLTDARVAAGAIQEATGTRRVNYAVLGNAEPHVHFHLIPRGGPADPAPGRSPWQTTSLAEPLHAKRRTDLVQQIGSSVLKRREVAMRAGTDLTERGVES